MNHKHHGINHKHGELSAAHVPPHETIVGVSRPSTVRAALGAAHPTARCTTPWIAPPWIAAYRTTVHRSGSHHRHPSADGTTGFVSMPRLHPWARPGPRLGAVRPTSQPGAWRGALVETCEQKTASEQARASACVCASATLTQKAPRAPATKLPQIMCRHDDHGR